MLDRICPLVSRNRLLDTATRLIAIPSPTGDAGAVLDTLADLLQADGFTVSREAGGHAKAPAVVQKHAARARVRRSRPATSRKVAAPAKVTSTPRMTASRGSNAIAKPVSPATQ